MELLFKKDYSEITKLPLLVEEFRAKKRCEPQTLSFSENPIQKSILKSKRKELSEVLYSENLRLGASKKSLENAKLIADEDCKIVITGQQPCLFTGPSYVIYKAITAVNLAEKLKREGKRAVAVFWVATEDSDFSEVSRAEVGGDKYTVEFEKGIDIVGNGKIPREIPLFLADFRKKSEIRDFGDFFCTLMSQIFAETGLVMCDPRALRGLTKEIKVHEIENPLCSTAIFTHVTDEVKARGIKPQIDKSSDFVNLYLLDNGERKTLRYRDGAFFTPDGASYSAEQLKNRADELVPNAILRPIIQEFLFSSRYLIAGANELNYLLLLPKLFDYFDVKTPEFVLRNGFFLLDHNSTAFLKRFGIDFSEILTDKKLAFERMLEMDENMRAFDEGCARVLREIDELRKISDKNDFTLGISAEATRKKVEKTLSVLRKKNINKLKRTEGNAVGELVAVCEKILPQNGLQERYYNIFSYASSVSAAQNLISHLCTFSLEEGDVLGLSLP